MFMENSISLKRVKGDDNIEQVKLKWKGLLTIGLAKQKFQRKNVNIFLPISFNICFGCSKEPSH